MDPIIFNSKSVIFWQLSNFYGGTETCYMKDRFGNLEIKKLFDEFASCNKVKFLYYLQKLQPGKKWTDGKLNYWFKNGKPINGILSKLAGASVKDTPTGKKRLKILIELAGLSDATKIKIKPNKTNDEKQELMLECLRIKYSNSPYKEILLSTGNAELHEKPMRGSGDFWTFPGGDSLGKLLMIVRNEIIKN
jgi:hypothetical protein